MKVSVSKRNSNTLDISLNSEGKKLVYNTAVQKEPNQINNSNNNEQNPSIQNPASPPPPKLESKPSLNVILPKKDNKISFQFTKSTSTPTSQSPTNQKTDNKFHYKPKEQNLTETSNKQLKFEDENPSTINKTKIQQKNYITTTQKLIDEIQSNPPEKIANKLQSNIEFNYFFITFFNLFFFKGPQKKNYHAGTDLNAFHRILKKLVPSLLKETLYVIKSDASGSRLPTTGIAHKT